MCPGRNIGFGRNMGFGSSWMVACAALSKDRFCALSHALFMACPCVGKKWKWRVTILKPPKQRKPEPRTSRMRYVWGARSAQANVDFGCTLMS